MLSEEQLDLISAFIEGQMSKAERKVSVFLDPIMGDVGKLYKGMPPERVGLMRKVAGLCDLITPNMTEACYLADLHVGEMSLTREAVIETADKLYADTGAVCVITSVVLTGSNEHAVAVHDGETVTFVPYEVVPARIAGTGDIFAALLTGRILTGVPLLAAVEQTADNMSYLLRKHYEEKDKYLGIPLEKYLAEMELLP